MRPEFRARLAEFVGTHRAWLREQVEEWLQEFSEACNEARVEYSGLLGPGESWTSIGAEEFDRRRAERREELAKERKFPPRPLPPPDPVVPLSFVAKCAGLAAYYDAHCELNHQHPDVLVVPEVVIEYPTPEELETRHRFRLYEYIRDNVRSFEEDWDAWERRLDGWLAEAMASTEDEGKRWDSYLLGGVDVQSPLNQLIHALDAFGDVEEDSEGDYDDEVDLAAVELDGALHEAMNQLRDCYQRRKIPTEGRNLWIELQRICRHQRDPKKRNEEAVEAAWKLRTWAKEVLAEPTPLDQGGTAVTQSSTRTRKKPGRKTSFDPDADKKVFEAWETGQHKDYKGLANELGIGWTRKAVRLAILRHRARLRRAHNK